jgi:integrase
MGRKPGAPRVRLDEEHGDVYQFAFTVYGKRHRGSTGCRDRAAAEEEAGKLFAAALAGKRPPRRARALKRPSAQEDLIDLFAAFLASLQGKKSDSYTRKMRSHFSAHFAHRWRRLDEMCVPGAIDAYASARLAGDAPAHEPNPRRPRPKNASSVTVHKELVTLRRFLKWARKMEYIAEVPHIEPVDQVSDYTPPDYTPEQARALLALLPDRTQHRHHHPVREFFTVQWAQAARPGEIESMRACDVNLKRGEMTIRQSEDKARVGRVVALAEEAHGVLADMFKVKLLPEALVFGEHDYRTQLEKAAAELKLRRPTRHNLRHFRLSELGGLPGTAPAALQFLAGHKHMATTDRYIRSRTKETAKLFEAAQGFRPGSASKKKSSRREVLPDSAPVPSADRRRSRSR